MERNSNKISYRVITVLPYYEEHVCKISMDQVKELSVLNPSHKVRIILGHKRFFKQSDDSYVYIKGITNIVHIMSNVYWRDPCIKLF